MPQPSRNEGTETMVGGRWYDWVEGISRVVLSLPPSSYRQSPVLDKYKPVSSVLHRALPSIAVKS